MSLGESINFFEFLSLLYDPNLRQKQGRSGSDDFHPWLVSILNCGRHWLSLCVDLDCCGGKCDPSCVAEIVRSASKFLMPLRNPEYSYRGSVLQPNVTFSLFTSRLHVCGLRVALKFKQPVFEYFFLRARGLWLPSPRLGVCSCTWLKMNPFSWLLQAFCNVNVDVSSILFLLRLALNLCTSCKRGKGIDYLSIWTSGPVGYCCSTSLGFPECCLLLWVQWAHRRLHK